MITYKIWRELLYEGSWLFGIITAWSVFRCLLLSILAIPMDILLFPIEILGLIIFRIIKLKEKIKEEK